MALEARTKLERLGEQLLNDRAEVVELGRKANAAREAAAELRRRGGGGKVWLCVGETFVRVPTPKAESVLRKGQFRPPSSCCPPPGREGALTPQTSTPSPPRPPPSTRG
jgi:hypothetical protein